MNAGWRSQYETEAISSFALILRWMAEERTQDAELQAFARKAKLTAIMLIAQEKQAIETGSVCKDRLSDCNDCRRENGGMRPCKAEPGKDRVCRWETPEHKLRTINRHFGPEGMKWVEEAGKYAEKRLEAKACT